MARGAEGKANVVKKLQAAFGADFIGEYDKKVYVWSQENGEKIQIAISMTCPKNPVGEVTVVSNGGLDFSAAAPTAIAPAVHEPAEITEEEKANIADLMAKLGL